MREDGVLAVGEGQTISLICEISFRTGSIGYSDWTYITWLKNWERIDYNQRIFYIVDGLLSSSILRFNTTVAEDSGVYTCYASLNFTRGSDSVTLNVEVEKPTAPKLIEVLCGYGNLATVAWEPGPENNATFRQFIIEHTNSYTPNVWTRVVGYNCIIIIPLTRVKKCRD